MNVKLMDHTPNAKALLIFSKRTRHMTTQSDIADILEMVEQDQDREISYVFSTIGSSWEFVTYTFYITDVTRAFTHQLVRHRVGVAFAQQAQRVGTQEDFGYMTPVEIGGDPELLLPAYDEGMRVINRHYKDLLELGARPQDARGLLPTNIHTNILVKMNLRALSDMLTVRLCIRAQGEFQTVARELQRLVLDVHPWAHPVLAPNCIRHSVCKFPRYKDCPISQEFPELLGLSDDKVNQIRTAWEKVAGYDPQPRGSMDEYGLNEDDTEGSE